MVILYLYEYNDFSYIRYFILSNKYINQYKCIWISNFFCKIK